MNNRRKIYMLNQKKRRRKYKKKRYMLYYILFGIVIITTILILSFTVFFNIEEIEITGTYKRKKNDILKISGIKEGDNLILTNSKKAEKSIFNNIKDVEDVTVIKHFPDTIEINCNACVLNFCCQKNDKKFILVSKNNRIIRTNANSKPKNIFCLEVSGIDLNNQHAGDFFKLPEKDAKNFEFVKNAINSEKTKNITKVKIKDNTISIIFEDRVVLVIDEPAKTSYLLNLSLTALKNIIGPFETGRLIYIKPKKALHFIPTKELPL